MLLEENKKEFKKSLADNHIHSEHSFDGSEKIFDICKKAVECNLSVIAITDHCDINPNPEQDLKNTIAMSYKDTLMAKDKFAAKLQVLTGIELGQPLENIALAQKILDRFDLDFTLLSLHNLPEKPDFYYMDDFSEKTVNKVLEEYFVELAHTIKEFNCFDSLAHLTYPLRYVYLRSNTKPNLNLFSHLIDDILKLLVLNNKALEINISGLTSGLNCSFPGGDILRRFKDLGGKYITIGSDSHTIEKIGVNISDGLKIIKNSGFNSITIFEKHKPRFINI